ARGGDNSPSIWREVWGRGTQRRAAAGDSPPPRSENRIGRSGVARSARAVCNVTSAAWRSGCRGMVRPPVLPLLARLGTCSTSATCPCASVTIAQVSAAIALARRPAFIDNRNMTRSRTGSRVVTREPRMARSWVGLTMLACLPCIGTLQSTEAYYSYVNCLETEECYESAVVSRKNVGQTSLLSTLHHKLQ